MFEVFIQGGTPRRGFPLNFCLCTCAPIRWVVVDGLSCHSTPFLWCLPKETVSSRQRKALFLPRCLHHSRERYCPGCLYSSSPDLGEGAGGLTGRSSQLDAVGGDVGASSPWERRAGPNTSRGGTLKRVSLGLHPISLLARKETGVEPQRKAPWVPPRQQFGPARLSHEHKAPTSPPTASS